MTYAKTFICFRLKEDLTCLKAVKLSKLLKMLAFFCLKLLKNIEEKC